MSVSMDRAEPEGERVTDPHGSSEEGGGREMCGKKHGAATGEKLNVDDERGSQLKSISGGGRVAGGRMPALEVVVVAVVEFPASRALTRASAIDLGRKGSC